MEEKRLELYLHIPFCDRKCAYCDFLSGPADWKTREKYIEALCGEIRASARRDYRISTIFFGGGTPSVLEGEWMEKLMETVRNSFDVETAAEISMEANPGTLTGEKLSSYKRAGINRLSLGCQSVHSEELKKLGRIHTYEMFEESVFMAREAGFENMNVDLMSGLPDQTLEKWELSLEKIASLSPEHISAYSLIVEEGTPFAEQELQLPDEETERKMYERTGQILKAYGYEQYEISNYAKPGYACRHNVGYWQRVPYLGMGIGASSLFEECRYQNTSSLEQYLACKGQPEQIREDSEVLSEKDQMEEFCFLGLRMMEGISKKTFLQKFNRKIEAVYGEVLDKYRKLGLLEEREEKIRLTRAGISVSNQVMTDFLLDD